ncbi:MAG TPA: cation-translocating P-type ATPase [Rubrivivax sp.]|nr:cation-translocating P-type ATPase [Rubrivivax sp.]
MTAAALPPSIHPAFDGPDAGRRTPHDAGAQAAATLDALDDPLEQGRFTRWIQGAHGERLAESSLQLAGMHCAACAGIIEQALAAVPGVCSARVSAAAQRASVCWDPARTRASALVAAVRALGYAAVPDAAAPARAMRRAEARQALWRLFVAAFCGMQVMMLATPGYVAAADELAPDLRQLLNASSWLLTLPVLVFAAGPFFSGAWRSLKARRIGMDVPVALGIAITFVAGSGATFAPGGLFGREVYFDSLTMFVAFLLAARFVEMRSRHRSAEALEASLARMPQTAWRIEPDDSTVALPVHRLVPGDRALVPVGEAFPADGTLAQGATQADESLLSGESAPVAKAPGAEVVAGSVNLGAPVRMHVQRVGADTRFEAIVSMMRSAATQRPAAARVADRWAGPFLAIVLVLAAAAALAWSQIDAQRAVWVAVSVLIVTCPCALSLAAPATIVAAARAWARRGVVVQRLDAIETLARVDQVFFDKTGTLTTEGLRVAAVQAAAGAAPPLAPDEALACAAALAAWSTHPVARALVAAAAASQARSDALAPSRAQREIGPIDTAAVQELPGRGLVYRDARGRQWRLGAPGWAGEGAAPAARVVLGVDGCTLAGFALEEALREGAAEAVRALRSAGVRVSLLSGDTDARARALAARLGIDDVLAGATPAAKLEALAAAQRAGRCVAMVGDGVNDAPVLARADVSFAMGQGALVARAQADAVIVSGRLGDLACARASALRAMRIVRQNLGWAAIYNALGIPLAFAGWLPPWLAGLGMAASSLFVVLNAMRAAALPAAGTAPSAPAAPVVAPVAAPGAA